MAALRVACQELMRQHRRKLSGARGMRNEERVIYLRNLSDDLVLARRQLLHDYRLTKQARREERRARRDWLCAPLAVPA